MLSKSETIHAVARSLEPHQHLPIILDPVMVSTSGHLLIEVAAMETLKTKLLPLCELITPNIYEAAVLVNFDVQTIEDMKKAAYHISLLGIPNVLIKGGDRNEEKAIDVLYCSQDNRFDYFEENMVETTNTHGTGCSLSTAIAAHRSQGLDLLRSVKLSKQYVYEAIKAGSNYKMGQGRGPIHHYFQYWK